MIQTFGDFSDELPASQEYLVIVFSPSSAPLKQRWRTNGLSANFLANCLTTFFPSNEEEPTAVNKQAKLKSAVSFIANELLENAMKFSDETSLHPISIQLQLHSGSLVFLVTNSIKPQAVSKFQAFIQELTTSDPDELYIRQIEKNAADEMLSGSGLGLLIIMNNYQAEIGWKFETVQKDTEVISVTTMVQLAM